MRLFTKDTSRKFGGKFFAFTMAEILISLTIIGVIAAIIIPSLHANIEKKTMATKKKAFYNRMMQALPMIERINKFGQYSATYDGENSSLNITVDTGAMDFVTNGLGKVLKLNNICDNDNFSKCGIPDKITTLNNGSKIDFPKNLAELYSPIAQSKSNYSPINTKAVAFETVNGESAVVYYNPKCVDFSDGQFNDGYWMPRICLNIVYDLNGKKGPNKIYEDIHFITVLSPDNPRIVAPQYRAVFMSTTVTPWYKTCPNSYPGTKAADTNELISLSLNSKLFKSFYCQNNACFATNKPNNGGTYLAIRQTDGSVFSWSGYLFGFVCINK